MLKVSETIYVGIDPGGSGGLAAIGDGWVRAIRTPKDCADVWRWLDDINNAASHHLKVAMEKVTGYVGSYGQQGGDTGSSMLKLGISVGRLEMAITFYNIKPHLVMSHVWQEYLEMTPRYKVGNKYSESKPQFKKRLKEFAQKLFPEVKVTLYNCDALLIAEYLKRKTEGLQP